jgi:hypothetical protein
MPIRPENKARYPKDWPQIRERIRARSGNRCECLGECGLRHVAGDKGNQLDLPPSLWTDAAPGMRCTAVNGEPHPATKSKVVLTVAHLNHVPEDCDDQNLRHFCQRCNNRYDAPMRRAGIRQRAREAVGALDLFAEAT